MKINPAKLLKIIGGIIAGIIVLLVGAFFALNSNSVQNKLLQKAVTMLKEKLHTEVSIDSVSISILSQDFHLYGVEIEDLQHRKMLDIEELGVSVDLYDLMQHQLTIHKANIKGLEAHLFKASPDTAANYQFIIDAFKKPKKEVDSTATPKKKVPLTVDLQKVDLERIKVSYNEKGAELGRLFIKKSSKGRYVAEAKEVVTEWVAKTKKGPADNRLRIGVMGLAGNEKEQKIIIDSLCFTTNNHKARANTGKPHRGFFDAGHLDIVAKLIIKNKVIGKDSIEAVIQEGSAVDRGSGLTITRLNAKVAANKKTAHLSDIVVSMPHTILKIAKGDVQLPSKKEGRRLQFRTSTIKGKTQLRDIAKPFARVLSDFTIPLLLSVEMSGNDNALYFRNIVVATTDGKLKIKATGHITNLKDKYKLNVHFDVHNMVARGDSKERIISQFPVKKFMMKQLRNLGRIEYQGHFDVLWKKEAFTGLLKTEVGNMDFYFALDETNKYVNGTASTDSLELGKAMDMKDLGKIACKADFQFDISKPRTAIMRRQKGGKLPIGNIHAEVKEAKYKFVKVRNVIGTIESDGAIATGNVVVRGKRVDMLCSFSFTNTDDMQKTKIKPGIKFHKLSEENKASKAERKALKEEEKAQRKVEKAQLKAIKAEIKRQRKAAEAAAKEQREAEKAAERALREAEKAQRKAEKAAEKAQRKAEKEAQKAAKKAAQEAAQTEQQ